MGYHSLKLCAGGGGFEAVPAPRLSLDLRRVKGTLESHDIPVVDARVMLIAQLEREVTLSRDGRVLIKTKDGDEAAAVFARLRELLDLPAVESGS
jgi:hypothetical protein